MDQSYVLHCCAIRPGPPRLRARPRLTRPPSSGRSWPVRRRRRQEDQVALAPEIRQQLRHGGDEGPSQHRSHDFAQRPSGFDRSSSRAMARLLDREAEARARHVRLALIRASDDSLFRCRTREKIGERLAVFRRSNALLRHFGSWRIGVRAKLEQF